MAVSAKSEEIVLEVARAAGSIYDALTLGVGSEEEPGTALFEIYNLEQMALQSLPQFGILETDPAGFEVTYDETDPYVVTVGPGQVGYQDNRISVLQQKVSIRRAFAQSYNNSDVFGVRLGFPLVEAQRSTQVWNTVVTTTVTSSATELPIQDTALARDLGFPLQAHVGQVYLVFSGLNDAGTALVVDPSFYNGSAYGTVGKTIYKDTPVRFIYEPRVQAIAGFPVAATGPTIDPELYGYYPPLPPDWLPIADVVVVNPDNPRVYGTEPDYAIHPAVVAYPAPDSEDPLFSDDDALTIASACATARQSLRAVRDSSRVTSLLQALRNYTVKKSGSSQTSFRKFWASQPFRPLTNFTSGVSFAGLERIEFPQNFARAYYELLGEDLQHTFGIFRGDLVSSTHPILGNSTVGGVDGEALKAGSVTSSLSRGTYIYGVSAVLPTGETPPTYVSIAASATSPTYFVNEVLHDAVASAQFYHIYRRANIAGDQTEYRLTDVGEVAGIGKFTNTPAAVAQYDTLSTTYTAIKIVPTGASYLGGVSVPLKVSATLTNGTQSLQFTLHANNAGAPGDLIATGTSIHYSALTASPDTYLVRFEPDGDNTLNIIANGTYWLKITRTAAPAGGNIQIGVATSGTNQLYTSSNNSTWSAVSSRTASFTLRGFLDNGLGSLYPIRRGVHLTGRTALTPRRLSVLVPAITELPAYSSSPFYSVDGSALAAAATDTTTKNDMVVTVIARNGESGTPTTLTATVPKGTERGSRFVLGTATQLFDRVDDVQVRPGINLTIGGNGQVDWDAYDFITVETVP